MRGDDEIRFWSTSSGRIHGENYGVYGVRKMWYAARRAGWDIGRDQVARLMRLGGIAGVRRGRRPITTRSAKDVDHRPDLVHRCFMADRPNQLWAARYHVRAHRLGFRLYRVCHRCSLSHDRRPGLTRPGRALSSGGSPTGSSPDKRLRARPADWTNLIHHTGHGSQHHVHPSTTRN